MELLIRQGEVLSLRSAARNLYGVIEQLDSGSVSKYVLLDSKNALRAVVLTADEYSRLLREAGRIPAQRAAA